MKYLFKIVFFFIFIIFRTILKILYFVWNLKIHKDKIQKSEWDNYNDFLNGEFIRSISDADYL